jgi:hypothetical protein
VAFIGTSRTVYGIDSVAVEQACMQAGEARCHTVNFGLQHLGRDVQWLITKELLENRAPRLLVVEVQETEARALHPAFAYLADIRDIAAAPIVINTSFLSDLVYLPRRQAMLFATSLAPALFDAHRAFIAALYRGAHWDDTYAESGSAEHPISPVIPRTRAAPVKELEEERAHSARADAHRLALPGPLRPLEYRANLIYLQKLLALARDRHVEVRFLYMPAFSTSAAPAFDSFYARFAPVWQEPDALQGDSTLWTDVNHFNYQGALALSAWLGGKIANGGDKPISATSVTQAGTN